LFRERSEIITRRDETRAQKPRGIPFVMATKKYDDEVSDDTAVEVISTMKKIL
jgi:hypothetical protein